MSGWVIQFKTMMTRHWNSCPNLNISLERTESNWSGYQRAERLGGGFSSSGPVWNWPAPPTAGCATEPPVAVGWTTCPPSASVDFPGRHSPETLYQWRHSWSWHHNPTLKWPDSPSEDTEKDNTLKSGWRISSWTGKTYNGEKNSTCYVHSKD